MGNIPELAMLTRAGILDFDAESYIKGQPQPNPQTVPRIQPYTPTPTLKQIKQDVYHHTKEEGLCPPPWKKITATILALGVAGFLGYKAVKGKSHPIEYLKKNFHPIEWIKGVFNRKKATTPSP